MSLKFSQTVHRENQVPRLFVLVILVLAIGFSLSTTMSYLITREYLLSTEISQTLPLISKTIYTEIMEEMLPPVYISSLMANDSFLIQWVAGGEQDLTEISQFLDLVKRNYGYSSAFFVSDITGKYYTPQGILKEISTSQDHDAWYYKFKESNQKTDLDVDTDEAADNKMTVFINHRLETDDDFLGVVGVGLYISDLGGKLSEYQDQFNHQVYFVDSAGLIQVHSNEAFVEQKTIFEVTGMTEPVDTFLEKEGEFQTVEYRNSKGKNVLSFRYFPEFDWYLIVEKNPEQNLSFTKRAVWQNIAIGSGVLLMVSILILQLIRVYSRRLNNLAARDSLTGISNRRSFSYTAERELKLAQRHQTPLSLLMIDIKDFKNVNDTYGHVFGDQLLKTISQTISDTLRETDLIGRWGGDEFLVLLVNAGKADAKLTAERIKEAVQEINNISDHHNLSFQVHIGITTVNTPEDTLMDLIQMADKQLIESKKD